MPRERARTSDARRAPGRPLRRAAADEVVLMACVAAEQIEAFDLLYRLYYPRLSRYLCRMLGRPTLAEEVLDDTMLLVWRKAGSYDNKAKVSSWIFGIAYRQGLKALDRIAVAVEYPFDFGHDESLSAWSIAAPENGPEDEADQRRLSLRLNDALDALSAEHRAVIELNYYLGYACREIADLMDCPVDTVKTRMFYARRRLKALMRADRPKMG